MCRRRGIWTYMYIHNTNTKFLRISDPFIYQSDQFSPNFEQNHPKKFLKIDPFIYKVLHFISMIRGHSYTKMLICYPCCSLRYNDLYRLFLTSHWICVYLFESIRAINFKFLRGILVTWVAIFISREHSHRSSCILIWSDHPCTCFVYSKIVSICVLGQELLESIISKLVEE